MSKDKAGKKTVSTLNLFWEPINLFEKHKKVRLVVLDICRGCALFGMLLYNVIWYIGSSEVRHETFLGFIHNYIFTFPVVAAFHLMLGIYLVYAQPTTKKLLLRGTQLLILGYLLSIVRYLPIIIGTYQGVYNLDDFLIFDNMAAVFLGGDIFHYAGLALLAFALVRMIVGKSVRPVYLFLLAVPVFFAPLFLTDKMTGFVYFDWFLNLFWGTTNVHYPFFPWFSYSLAGAMFGCILIRLEGFKRMEKAFTVTGIILFLTGILLVDFFNEPSRWFFQHFEGGLQISPETFIRVIGYYMCWQALFIWLHNKVPENFVLKTFSFWSNNVMTFYIWHAIALGWIAGMIFQTFRQQNLLETSITIVFILFFSHYFTRLTNGFAEKKLRAPVQKQ